MIWIKAIININGVATVIHTYPVAIGLPRLQKTCTCFDTGCTDSMIWKCVINKSFLILYLKKSWTSLHWICLNGPLLGVCFKGNVPYLYRVNHI
jgi:hypothetical protein